MTKATAFLLAGMVVGCGHAQKKDDDQALAGGGHRAGWKPGEGPGDSSPGTEIKVDSELGVLQTADVEDTIAAHFENLRGCYRHAGRAQRYAGGQVLLRFLIGPNGKPDDVLVAESDLGNYSVERCLVHVGRDIAFKPPEGHKATSFDYPIEFRASGQAPVLNLDGLKVEHDLSRQRHQLAGCGAPATEPVAAIFYIEPNGLVGSVGLSGASPLDEGRGDCIVHTIQKWHMSATLPGHFLRCNFSIPPVVASAELAAKSTSPLARRRHR
ncbi:MAG TPA: TonB family protein [Polyangia bacterium]|jgi:TonB family protein